MYTCIGHCLTMQYTAKNNFDASDYKCNLAAHVCLRAKFFNTYFVIVTTQFIKTAMNCSYSIYGLQHPPCLFNQCLKKKW